VNAAANPEAYNAYLLGQHLIKKRTKGDIEAAIPNYERAIEFDPLYAPAHASLGLAWYLLTDSRPTYGTLTLEDSLGKALPHIEKALQLDAELADAHGAMGLTLDARQRYEEAVPYYEEALRLNPSQIDVRNWFAQTLDDLGREQEALAQMETAYELDPLSVLTLHNYTNELVMRRQYDQARPVIERLTQLDPSRAAIFKFWTLSSQGEQANAVIELFLGADSNPGDLLTRSNAAFSLLNFGLDDDALQVWPYPNILPIVSSGFDDEYTLELAKKQFEEDPTNPTNVETLAWAYWAVDDKDQALKHARRYRESLGKTRGPIDGINRMFAIDAWQRGESEEMLSYLEPLAEDIDRAMASGVDMFFINVGKSSLEYLKGDEDSAYRYLEKALSIGLMLPSAITLTYETLGWNKLPKFEALRKEHEAYRRRERSKFLAVACGPDGFTSWQPSPETCAEIDSI
jgi:tetratricopeptide (TPR) repeat protein